MIHNMTCPFSNSDAGPLCPSTEAPLKKIVKAVGTLSLSLSLKGLFIALGIFHFLFNSRDFLLNPLPAKIIMQRLYEHTSYTRRKSSAPIAKAVVMAMSPQI